jgi:mannose-6-phosphate isomerase-like protein (cupin superfamily)
MRHGFLGVFTVLICGLLVVGSAAAAQQQPALVIKALAEKKVAQLPAGPLFWRLETFPTIAQARAAAGTTGLAAESAGRAWLFTLGPAGGSTAGGTKVAEIGPLPGVVAPEYLLRINEATGVPGSITAVHSHPGSEAFYVLAGQQTIRTPDWIILIGAGQAEAGPGGGTPLQVSSSGGTDLHALVMFVVDATKPFSSPATFR